VPLVGSRRQGVRDRVAAPGRSARRARSAQAARNRAMKLYRASLPYGKRAASRAASYYLGEAASNLKYAKFVESLPVDTSVNEPTPSAGDRGCARRARRETVGHSRPIGRGTTRSMRALCSRKRGALRPEALRRRQPAALESRLALSRATKKPEKPDLPMPEFRRARTARR